MIPERKQTKINHECFKHPSGMTNETLPKQPAKTATCGFKQAPEHEEQVLGSREQLLSGKVSTGAT